MTRKVKIDDVALQQLLEIRDKGVTNMFDFHAVQRIAYENDAYDLVNWMEEHRNEYGVLIMFGADEGDEGDDDDDDYYEDDAGDNE